MGLVAVALAAAWAVVQAAGSAAGVGPGVAAVEGPHQVFTPFVTRQAYTPPPFVEADVAWLEVPSAGVSASSVVEPAGTVVIGGEEYFATPSNPGWIAWYENFGEPGRGGSNTLLSAHLNYYGYGAPTPFAHLDRVVAGETIRLGLDDGRVLVFRVISVHVYSEVELTAQMPAVVYPALPQDRERVTLITCAGDFIPSYPGGPGVYNARLVVVGERVVE